jgi:hypothetical protein
MECGLGFTEPELVIIRLAIEGGAVGVAILGLAFIAKLVRQWLDWRE